MNAHKYTAAQLKTISWPATATHVRIEDSKGRWATASRKDAHRDLEGVAVAGFSFGTMIDSKFVPFAIQPPALVPGVSEPVGENPALAPEVVQAKESKKPAKAAKKPAAKAPKAKAAKSSPPKAAKVPKAKPEPAAPSPDVTKARSKGEHAFLKSLAAHNENLEADKAATMPAKLDPEAPAAPAIPSTKESGVNAGVLGSVCGFSPTSVLRTLGRAGWSPEKCTALFERLKIKASPITIRNHSQAGAKGVTYRGEYAPLSADQIKGLAAQS